MTCQILFIRILLITLLFNTVAQANDSIEKLGAALFFDTTLSKNQTQSCATCHAIASAFTDPRSNITGRSVSLGDDGHSLQDRHTPTLSYVAFTPDFTLDKEQQYVGGHFYDGREKNLTEQAKQPFLNPSEMGMPDETSVVARVFENTIYRDNFKKHYGENIFDDTAQAYQAIANSIAMYQKSELFSPFDSKYDRYLRGEYEMTETEELGMTLFFSQQFTNCNICHQLRPAPSQPFETFSNYEYHNIGVPVNTSVRKANGLTSDYIDQGLLNHPEVNDIKQAGKFKVPTLRNIAVTPPYMHNGIFADLRTVVLFYNKYNSKSDKRQINPETNKLWRRPEVEENISLEELQTGPALDDQRIDALVAFMKTLTDQRYEHLLDE